MPSTKRSSDDAGFTASKSARLSEDVGYAAGSKRKSAGSSRTGQACDRCKVRKIRCDAKVGGCSPCLQNNTECKTTDRITGRATSRGHTETVEAENSALKVYMVELQQQLRDSGIEPKAPPAVPQGYMSAGAPIPFWSQTGSSSSWDTQHANGSHYEARDRRGSHGTLSDFRQGCIGDNYLGVSSGNNWLSPIEGSSLSLFGAKIDLKEFMPAELEDESSAMSYQNFLTHAFGGSSAAEVPPLPHWEQCKVYGEWYFRSIQQFIPILHKPDFMQLIHRIYHEGYQPTAAETVMVHMVLTVIKYQYSARNINDQARDESFKHFQYSLSFVPQLMIGHRLEDMQALTLICSQLRNFPRPGAAWMFTSMVLSLAIEQGLHRSATAWEGSSAEKDPHIIEMRKRIFWSLMVFQVTVGGKLGRPMPLRMDDLDIEFPEAVHDNLPEEAGLPKWRKCSFRASLYGFRLVKIMMQVYGTIYSIRSSNSMYEAHIRQLENELRAFQQTMPPELSGGASTKDEDRVSALYLQLSVQECELLLHHPSLCRSASPQIMSSNIDICLDVSSRMLVTATQLQSFKSLDTTLYYNMDFLAAIFTTLFAYTERRDQMTSADLQRLRGDMEAWLGVIGDVGNLLGTGPKLQEALRTIIDWSLDTISRHLAAKTASAAVASTSSPPAPNGQEQAPSQQIYDPSQHYQNGYVATTNGNGLSSGPQAETYPMPSHSAEPYQVAFPMSTFDPNGYHTQDVKPSLEAQLQMPSQPQQAPTNFLTAFQSPSQSNGYHGSPMQSGPTAWRHFADNMATNLGTGQYVAPAEQLLALETDVSGPAWPMIQYGPQH